MNDPQDLTSLPCPPADAIVCSLWHIDLGASAFRAATALPSAWVRLSWLVWASRGLGRSTTVSFRAVRSGRRCAVTAFSALAPSAHTAALLPIADVEHPPDASRQIAAYIDAPLVGTVLNADNAGSDLAVAIPFTSLNMSGHCTWCGQRGAQRTDSSRHKCSA